MSSSGPFPSKQLWVRLSPTLCGPIDWDRYDHAMEGVLLDQLVRGASFPVATGSWGHSDEGCVLRTLRFGQGKRRVLVWARQHGDEPDCTAALMTVLAHLFRHPGEEECRLIRENLDILVMPMVNPDGVHRFTRRNAQGIDINRDAAAGATTEGRALLKLKDEFQPEVCLNLHDMNSRKTNEEGHPVAVAFQACPFAQEQNDNPRRLQAKRICSIMADTAREFVGPNVARYTADFMPRAFGDNMMRWGVASVLIEAGGHDPAQGGDETVRRVFALCLLRAMVAIAREEDLAGDTAGYDAIPFDSGSHLRDLVLSGAMVLNGIGRPPFRADVAINRSIDRDASPGRMIGTVEDIGDLSEGYRHRQIDLSGKVLMPGLTAIAPGWSFTADRPTPREEEIFLRAGITTLACGFGPFASAAARLDWLETSAGCAPSLNIVAFERVGTLRELISRHGMSELAGLMVQDLAITFGDLVRLQHLFHAASPAALEDVDPEMLLGIDLLFESAPSPSQTRLHLHLMPFDGKRACTPARATELQRLADDFLRQPNQITFTVDATDAPLPWCPMLAGLVGLSNGRAPGRDFFGSILRRRKVTDGSGLVEVSNLSNINTSRLLRLGTFGRIDMGTRADLVAFEEGIVQDESHASGGAALVLIDGAVVLKEGEPLSMTGQGRWYFAAGVADR